MSTKPDLGREIETRALTEFKDDKFETAAMTFTYLIDTRAKEEEVAEHYANRAQCYIRLRRFDDALKDANTAISMNPSSPNGYFRKYVALRELRQYKNAKKTLEDGASKCTDKDKFKEFALKYHYNEVAGTTLDLKLLITETPSVTALDSDMKFVHITFIEGQDVVKHLSELVQRHNIFLEVVGGGGTVSRATLENRPFGEFVGNYDVVSVQGLVKTSGEVGIIFVITCAADGGRTTSGLVRGGTFVGQDGLWISAFMGHKDREPEK